MKKALIVDDIKENLYLLESLLKAYGYKTIAANNGAEALGLALNEPPDIVISDILMPVMDGYTLCREWKKDDVLKNIPFVFYTATYTHPKDEEFALSLGAEKFIIKPQEPDIFMSIIEKVLLEFRNGRIWPTKTDESSEIEMLKEYNETLIRKMEDRMLKSEEAEKKIRNYAEQLEAEIEQRKLATEALKESEDKYRSILANSGAAILLTSPDGIIFSANDFACKLFGLTEEEICRLGRDGLVDLSDPNLEILFNERKQFGHASGELTLIRNNGAKFQAEISSNIFHDKEGNDRTSMVIRDLTEQRKAEKALRDSELRFRVLAESSPVGIFTTNEEGLTTYVNPRWCEISQLSFEDALGNGWLRATHPDDRESLALTWQKAALLGETSKAEYRFVHPDGSEVWVIGQAVPQKNEQNIITGYLGTITDITERKKMEADLIHSKEKAEESDRLKTAFLHNISHEIRTPLNSIVGFSSLLTDPNASPEDRQYYSNIINQSSENLLSIIADIISIATIEAGQNIVNKKEVNLFAVCKQLYEQFNLKAKDRNINLICDIVLSDKEAIFVTDETKLLQILNNLIGNALKFTEHGSVSFGCVLSGDNLEFLVEDTGIGIAPEMHHEIFKRFRQVESTVTRKFGGSGLGLAISKANVELLGGRIWLESEIGKGSKFYFTIPYEPTGS
jgi:PAS domain S-box-containing protein